MPRRSTVGAVVVAAGLLMLGRALLARPRILVLHSFRDDSEHVRGFDAGIEAVLASNRRPVSVAWHSLGLDRRAGPEERRVAVADANREIGLFAPDLLIAVDDESNELVGREVARTGRTKVLYVSIDRPPETYGYGPGTPVTGVAERIPLEGVRDAISAARAGRPARVGAIAAAGETGRAELAQVRAFDWSPHRLEAAEVPVDFPRWQEMVAASAADLDVLLVLSAAGLERGGAVAGSVSAGVVPESEVVAWTEAHAKPLPIGTEPGWVALGGALAITPPAAPAGRLAMEMALDWLDERDGADPPPPVESSHFDVELDAARLRARGIGLPRVWVEAARVGDAARP